MCTARVLRLHAISVGIIKVRQVSTRSSGPRNIGFVGDFCCFSQCEKCSSAAWAGTDKRNPRRGQNMVQGLC
jgi:hypothetical protein